MVMKYGNDTCINLLKQGQSNVCWSKNYSNCTKYDEIVISQQHEYCCRAVDTICDGRLVSEGTTSVVQPQYHCHQMMPESSGIILLKFKINAISLSPFLKVTSES